jgi:hypothetical protein
MTAPPRSAALKPAAKHTFRLDRSPTELGQPVRCVISVPYPTEPGTSGPGRLRPFAAPQWSP